MSISPNHVELPAGAGQPRKLTELLGRLDHLNVLANDITCTVADVGDNFLGTIPRDELDPAKTSEAFGGDLGSMYAKDAAIAATS